MGFIRAVILILVLVIIVADSAPFRSSSDAILAAKHEEWMARHGRVYESKQEKEARFLIFKDNVKFIRDFNRAGNKTFKLGINQFADLTDDEFVTSHASGYKYQPSSSQNLDPSSTLSFMYENVSIANLPPSLDWRDYGAVTPIKSQLQCGCCWAFAIVAAIEGIVKIKTGELVSLSEQELLDCIGKENGCQTGNDMGNGYAFVANNGGLVRETDYLYEGVQGPCRKWMANSAESISSFEYTPSGDENAILQAVANQPVTIGIDGRSITRFYSGGIITPDYCTTEQNHGVAIVGYGEDDQGIKYWLVKNSWGTLWGENGYFRLQRDSGIPQGTCGLALFPSYPII